MILYREGYAPEMIFSGGSILKLSKKVLHTLSKSEDTSTMDVVEAAIMKEVSLKLGIPKQDVALDAASTHTYGNIRGLMDYMAERGLKTCLIVTSPTHMYRSYSVTQKLGLDCYPAPVRDYTRYINSVVGRLGLFRAVLWEYAGIFLYKFYGYI
jgi:uncharacterized SAM-binding protein YcdF (DUF218 family)